MRVLVLRRPSLPICVVTSGLVHLGLIGIFLLSTRFSFPSVPSTPTEVTFLQAAESEVKSPQVVNSLRRAVRPAPAVREEEAAETARDQESTELQPPVQTAALSEEQTAAAHREILNPYETEIAARLNALKRYPETARRMRHQGRVVVRFKIARDGQVLDREVIEPSAHGSLNQAAEELLSRLPAFRPFPPDSKVLSWVFTVPIEYRL